MNKVSRCLIAILLALSMLGTAALAEYNVGDTVENFTLTLSDGSSVTLQELEEKYERIVLNFWGTWCPWCVYEMPSLQNAQQELGERVYILCVSDADQNSRIEAFRQKNDFSLNMAYDAIGLSRQFVSGSYPVTALLDGSGRVLEMKSGALLGMADALNFIGLETENMLPITEHLEGTWTADRASVAGLFGFSEEECDMIGLAYRLKFENGVMEEQILQYGSPVQCTEFPYELSGNSVIFSLENG